MSQRRDVRLHGLIAGQGRVLIEHQPYVGPLQNRLFACLWLIDTDWYPTGPRSQYSQHRDRLLRAFRQ